MSRSFSRSFALFERAARVIPGGIYGHTNPAATLPMASPYYAVSGEGSRYRDADGNEYIDYLCGYGPLVLGFKHPEVEAAAEAQRQKGDCFNHPTPLMVDLAERSSRWSISRVGRVRQERLGHDHLVRSRSRANTPAARKSSWCTALTTAATRGARPATAG